MNKQQVTSNHIFILCCLSLTVTSMTFAIRAGILGDLGTQFGLTSVELGYVNSMAFLGFPVATMLGGFLYNALGARTLLFLAFICHLLGLVLTIYSGGFWGLIVSTFLIGFANGSVEAGCNPLIAELHPDNKTTMLNKFHVWFPGGIVIGALASQFMSSIGLDWQWQVGLILVPTVIYGAMLTTAVFPTFDRSEHSTTSNLVHLFSPLYLVLVLCFSFTAVTELGTQQWIERILSASGAAPMLVLAMITGVMAIGRYFAGPLVHKLNPIGILVMSSIVSALGIYTMSISSGAMVYAAALLFAVGVTYFWPTMLGCVSEYTPKTGALGLSLAGGIGMFSVSMWNPVIGGWIDTAKAEAQAANLSPEQIDVVAGQSVLQNLFIFPCIVFILFTALYVYFRRKETAQDSNDTASSTQ